MNIGDFYGIGIGPGDPELITIKGAKIISRCNHVFVPKAKKKSASTALSIAKGYINPESIVHEILFPMIKDPIRLEEAWKNSAKEVGSILLNGEDACFLTLGDSLLYSTYIYLVRAIQKYLPGEINIITVPGINAFSAAAALTEFPIGEGKQLVTIVPTADDFGDLKKALTTGGTVILMKISDRLSEILDILQEFELIDNAVLVSRAGMQDQQIETDLRKLKENLDENSRVGYLSIILVYSKNEKKQ